MPDAKPVRQCTHTLPIAIGMLEAPPDWCWRRTAEGDDLSGQLVDAHDQVRTTYNLFAFDARVVNPCANQKHTVKAVHGHPLDVCVLANGHHCASLDRRVSLCTDADFDVGSVATMFRPKA